MKDTPDLKATVPVLILAVALVVGAMSGATAPVGAAQPTIDTSTSDQTSSTTEVQAGDTLGLDNSFSANDSNTTTLQYVADSNDSKVRIEGPNGVQVYANTSANQVSWNSTQGDGNFNVTVNHGALDDLERGVNENVTTTWYVTNNTSADSPATTNITVYVESDNSKSVEVISDQDVDDGDIVTVEQDAFEVAGMNITAGPLGADVSTIETESRNVNGSTTDVAVVFGNESVADDFSSVAEDADSGEKLSSLVSLNRNVVLLTDSDDEVTAVPVYFEEAPDDVDEDSTYAVQKDVGGQDGIVVNLGSDFEDASSVEVETAGSAGLFTAFTDYLMAGGSNAMPGMISALTSAIGFGGQGTVTLGALTVIPIGASRAGGA